METQIKLENTIINSLRLDVGVTAHFKWEQGGESSLSKLELTTYNKRHDKSFLLHAVYGSDRVEMMKELLEYVQVCKSGSGNTYTVEWSNKGEHKLYRSYFGGEEPLEVLSKFYFEKDKSKLIVFLVELNPIS